MSGEERQALMKKDKKDLEAGPFGPPQPTGLPAYGSATSSAYPGSSAPPPQGMMPPGQPGAPMAEMMDPSGMASPPPPPPPVGQQQQQGVPSAPPAYVPQAAENEVDVNELPPAYEDDVSCSAGIKRNQHKMCLVFTLGLLTVIILRILAAFDVLPEPANSNLNNPAIFWPIFAGVYLIYFIECTCSSTGAFTRNKTMQPELLVQQVQQSPPNINWFIQCYHYETRHRTRTVRDSNGNTRTEHYTERVRVNTHSARQTYTMPHWRDSSPQWLPPTHSLTKHKFYFGFSFSNASAAQRYNTEKAIFIATNNRDVHFDFNENRTIAGFRKHVLGIREGASLPCSVRQDMFWLTAVLGLSWLFRVHLSSFTGLHRYTFIKLIDA
ncbi:hypothetical protein PTSG_08043 [Salpingoeca rosetta]|uniref:Transmembrane protein n=1 Tax=Salpingoeca rosetta (strain ATCC 50818 / BSB-021) TaxID=946362 RepID=F2UHU3_SALR5|nr:uncharacterized protein PTSG_08043 [Salpingoeca rosetta]EGD76692.1 hypothetical protein PTSG_08043 [Salpingoeca rosetta]|eukprot:XP_004991064.1 hypothetical protein PTSG_08043 [Salpingoeca rosetta]